MGLFSKKKTKEMDLPPPPPPELQEDSFQDFTLPQPPVEALRQKGDLPPISTNTEHALPSDLPELPPLPNEDEYAHLSEEEAVAPIAPAPKTPPPKPDIREKPRPAAVLPVTKHLFVSVQDYRTVYDNVELMKEKILETDEILIRLHDIKKQQEEGLQQWSKQLEAVQQRITHIDEMLFAGE